MSPDPEIAQLELEPQEPPGPEPEGGGSDDGGGAGSDDFDDDFGDFDEFEAASPPAAHESPEDAPGENLGSDDIVPGVSAEIRQMLGEAPQKPLEASDKRFTHTAVGLWGELMADPPTTYVDWNKSSLHKRLVRSFQVPLNLDEALPKVQQRHISLETRQGDKFDMSKMSTWTLLSIVSEQAVEGMSEAELAAHAGAVQQALSDAQTLLDDLECHEMDLQGEKDVLEGMVESLLAYSQKNQREKMHKAHKR